MTITASLRWTPPRLSAAELAERLAGTLVGNGTVTICSVAPLADAGPDALSWIGDRKYVPKLATTRAGIVLVSAEIEVPPGLTAIRVADPDLALCVVLEALRPPLPVVPVGIDPTATVAGDAVVTDACIGPHVTVSAGAVIGAGTQLHAGVYIGPGVTVGCACVLWPNVVVREYASLGDRVVIHPNATIGADGFGYHQRGGEHRKIPQIGRVVIEDDVEIGAGTCIDRARSGETRIGRGSKIDNLVQIGHNCQIGAHCIIVSQCGLSGSTVLGDYALLAGQAGVADHVRIGSRAVITARAGVMTNVPDGAVFGGQPALDHRDEFRQYAAVRRLPKLVDQVRELTKRVQQLESANNHPA
ncbi:MAG: UDP-3-O-(3-hydroxymyristoyl)glucosamine N-acyltransferase [Phycisphaerales bacterium]|nr:UDP-3-O-(3-hydroxymyristoyl)glucosamine N-acyltransferase [Phycisphaerales bacterium]